MGFQNFIVFAVFLIKFLKKSLELSIFAYFRLYFYEAI